MKERFYGKTPALRAAGSTLRKMYRNKNITTVDLEGTVKLNGTNMSILSNPLEEDVYQSRKCVIDDHTPEGESGAVFRKWALGKKERIDQTVDLLRFQYPEYKDHTLAIYGEFARCVVNKGFTPDVFPNDYIWYIFDVRMIDETNNDPNYNGVPISFESVFHIPEYKIITAPMIYKFQLTYDFSDEDSVIEQIK